MRPAYSPIQLGGRPATPQSLNTNLTNRRNQTPRLTYTPLSLSLSLCVCTLALRALHSAPSSLPPEKQTEKKTHKKPCVDQTISIATSIPTTLIPLASKRRNISVFRFPSPLTLAAKCQVRQTQKVQAQLASQSALQVLGARKPMGQLDLFLIPSFLLSLLDWISASSALSVYLLSVNCTSVRLGSSWPFDSMSQWPH